MSTRVPNPHDTDYVDQLSRVVGGYSAEQLDRAERAAREGPDMVGATTVAALLRLLDEARAEVAGFEVAASTALGQLPTTMVLDVGPHDARPDDDPEPGDRCKDCGLPITWTGPSQYDWAHTDDPQNQVRLVFTTPVPLTQGQGAELWMFAERFGAVGARRYQLLGHAHSTAELRAWVEDVCGRVTVEVAELRGPTRIKPGTAPTTTP